MADVLAWAAIGVLAWLYLGTRGYLGGNWNFGLWSSWVPSVTVPAHLQAKLNEVAANIEVNPKYLAAVIDFETGGSWDPSVRNAAGSGGTGLIQFMPDTAADLGTSVDTLATMSAWDQLDYVQAYLMPYRGSLHTLDDTYMAVLYPLAIGQSSQYVLFAQGSIAYDQNQGLDLNGDGAITKGEAVERLRESL